MIKDRKAIEFTNLVQGTMSVIDYKTKFKEQSKYAPNLIATERDKAQKFQCGLNKEIRVKVAPFVLETFSEVLKRALVVEEDASEETNT